jgi:hypothetical protein
MTGRGIFSGLLALTFLQVVLSSTRSAERAGGVLKAVGTGVYRFMSPTVAAIPDLRERRKVVAPGEPPRIPYDPSSSGSGATATMPADWTTRPAAPRSVAT